MEIKCQNCGATWDTDFPLTGLMAELIECALCDRGESPDSPVEISPVEEKPKRHYRRRHHRASNIPKSKPAIAGKSKHGLRSKFTPEVDRFIRDNEGKDKNVIIKYLNKRFGVKTTINGLNFHISQKQLWKSKLRAAAESSMDSDDEEDLQTLPPEDDS